MIGDLARSAFVSDKAAAGNHRNSVRIAQRIAAGDIDLFIADTGSQREVARHRQREIEARMKVFDTLVEIGDILAVVSRPGTNSDGQNRACPRADVNSGIMGDALVENVDWRLTRNGYQ